MAGVPVRSCCQVIAKSLSHTLLENFPWLLESCPWLVGIASPGASLCLFTLPQGLSCLQGLADLGPQDLAFWDNSQMSSVPQRSPRVRLLCAHSYPKQQIFYCVP